MEISEAIKVGRRKILSCIGFELLEDLWWDGKSQCWVFSFRLMGTYAPTDFVPVDTCWYCLVSPNYPYGSIDIYPAAENGIRNTFQHQQYNSWDNTAKWRKGNICVSTSLGKWGRKFFNSEPYSATLRLEWHIRRCQAWVEAAANDTLSVNGDPFELPAFPKGDDYLFVFNESAKTFQNWQQIDENSGIVHFKEAFENAHIYPIQKFSTKSQEVVYDWGNFITESKGGQDVAVWVKFSTIPIREPWEIPSHWHELFDIAEKQHINIQETIYRYLFRSKKPGKRLLFIGFPLPERFGENNQSVYWFCCNLPDTPKINGYRNGTDELFTHLFKLMFAKGAKIKWNNTENWDKKDLSSRGSFSPSIQQQKYLLAGAGAVGSCLGELLVRLGCDNIVVADGDLLAAGNLARHTLTMDRVLTKKSSTLSTRLNSILPSAKIDAVTKNLDDRIVTSKAEALIETTDIFIDATGSDAAIEYFSRKLSGKDKIFISVSIGYGAKRLFCFMRRIASDIFDANDFHAAVAPWLQKEKSENPDPDFPLDGIGCWHPVFPARSDDIWMLVSTAIKMIENFLLGSKAQHFVVIEKRLDETGALRGIDIL